MSGLLRLALFAAGVQVNFNVAAVGTLVAASVAAYTSARLLRANRNKIIAETTDHTAAALERAARLWQEDNKALRERIAQLEATNERLNDRIDELERQEREDRDVIGTLKARLAAFGE